MNYFDQIEDYLFGRLSSTDLTAFEQAMINDALLKEAVEEAKLAQTLGEAAFEEETRSMVEESLSKTKTDSTKKLSYNTKLIIYLVGVAAVLALVVGGYMTAAEQDQMPVASYQYAALYEAPAWPIQRGGSNDQVEDLVLQYLNEGIPSAIDSLKSINTDMSNYWLTEIYAKEGIPDSVFAYAPSITDNKVIRDRIYYLKYISLIKLGQYDKANAFRESLPKDVDPYYDNYFKN